MRTSESSKAAGLGIFTAIATSFCCITPVFAALAGVGSITSSFSWIEPFRPYLIAITLLALATAWYQKLKPKTQEEIDCECEEDEKASFWQSRLFLVLASIFAITLLAFPSYSGIFFPEQTANQNINENKEDIKSAQFHIEGMTCTGCEHTINQAFRKIDGVLEAKSSFETGSALVKFDRSKVKLEDLATTVELESGYIVTGTEYLDDNEER